MRPQLKLQSPYINKELPLENIHHQFKLLAPAHNLYNNKQMEEEKKQIKREEIQAYGQMKCVVCSKHKLQILYVITGKTQTLLNLVCDSCGILQDIVFKGSGAEPIITKSKKAPDYIK